MLELFTFFILFRSVPIQFCLNIFNLVPLPFRSVQIFFIPFRSYSVLLNNFNTVPVPGTESTLETSYVKIANFPNNMTRNVANTEGSDKTPGNSIEYELIDMFVI